MKLAEIIVGQHYGAVDKPKSAYRVTPRQVEVLEIVTEEKRTYSGYTGAAGKRNVKRIKVRVLDGSNERSFGYEIRGAKKDAVIVIDAVKLVAKWEDLSDNIREAAEKEQREADAVTALVARVTAILGKRHANEWGYWHVAMHSGRLELEVDDAKMLDRLLTYAEAGKAAADAN